MCSIMNINASFCMKISYTDGIELSTEEEKSVIEDLEKGILVAGMNTRKIMSIPSMEILYTFELEYISGNYDYEID